VPQPITSMSIRSWSADFPGEISALRLVPYGSGADSVMYREVLAELAAERWWVVDFYDAKHVAEEAARILAPRTEEVPHRPRERRAPRAPPTPWAKDHRMALAATIVAA
jgi:hypothetical protein